MATVLEEYLVKFGFDTKLDGVDRMVSLLKSSKELFGGLREPFDAFNNALATLGTITNMVTKPIMDVVNMTTQTALAANELNDASKRLGVASEDLERFGYIADMSGSSAETMQQAFLFLNKEMAAAVDGNKGAAESFAKLGVKVKDAAGNSRDAGSVMRETLAAISKIEDPAKKNAAALGVFSKAAFDLKGVFENDTQALADLNEEFEILGGATSQRLISQGAEMDDSFVRVKRAVDGFKRSFAEGLMPVFNGFLKWVEQFLKTNGPGLRRFFEGLGAGLATFADVAGGALDTFYQAMNHVFDNFEVYGVIVLAFKAKAIAAAIATGAAWAAANAPLLLSIAAALAIFLVLEDLFGFLQGKDSVIGDIIANWSEWTETVREQSPLLGAIMDGIAGIAAWLMTAKDRFVEFLDWFKEFGAIVQPLKDVWSAIDSAIMSADQAVVKFFQSLSNVGNLWKQIKSGLGSLAGSLGIDIGGGTSSAVVSPTAGAVASSMSSSSTSNQTSNQVNAPITIQATPGMNERELATQVEQKFQEMFRSEVRSSYPDVAYGR